ncbi:MAG: tetratricopeptide repeat protein [Bacteriovoracaceae bacterium]|nr:tetratricopeptide repeat protein [Bacteriovoracaceae bacterium]
MKYLLFLLLISSSQLYASDVQERRNEIIRVINEELSEVQRLSSQVGKRDPELYLREAELNLEKARLIAETENERYLEIPIEKRRKIRKSDYFETSRKYMSVAQNLCQSLLSRFKKFNNKADVYYIMAYNAKEFDKDAEARKYFALAIKNSSTNSKTKLKSQIALADLYYNNKEYKKAVPLYEASLSRNQDRWWTKDAYNLSWCYFRNQNYSSAISKMNEVYSKSKNDKFVDMSAMVERDIGLFYATAGRTSEGLRFYQKLAKNFTDELLDVSRRLIAESNHAQAEKVLVELLKIEKNEKKRTEIQIELLELYATFGKIENFITLATELTNALDKNLLNPEQSERLKFQVGKQGARLQKDVIGKGYEKAPKIRETKAKQSIRLFGLSKKIEPSRSVEFSFLTGETYYAIGDYEHALSVYKETYINAGNTRYRKLSLDALLSTLGEERLSSKTKDEYYVFVYKSYLEDDAKSAKANTIFQKLFNVYYDLKKMDDAENTLEWFRRSFPNDYKVQEAMIAKLMDYYRNSKQYDKVVVWIKKIQAGDYKVSAQYKEKVALLLTNMQMQGVQSALGKGNKVFALDGYLKIYHDSKSTEKSKKNSAYNIAVLYYELGNTAKTYEWALKAMKEMEPQDIKQFDESFLTLTTYLFNVREFLATADLSERALGKLCRTHSDKKDIFFKNALFVYLAENNLDKAEEMLQMGGRCNVGARYLNEARFELLKELAAKKRWESYEEIVNRLDTYTDQKHDFIPYYHQLKLAYEQTGQGDKAREMKFRILEIFNKAKASKKEILLESADIVADYLFEMVELDVAEISNLKLTFPEATFNDLLKRKIVLLDKVTNSALKVHQTGSGKGIVMSYYIIVKAYKKLVQEIRDFSPEGKSAEYVTSFKKSMMELTDPILKSAENYRRDAMREVNKNKIMAKETFLFVSLELNYPVTVGYDYGNGIIMDRGGKK